MKILLVTAIHQRHALAKVILEYYRHWNVMRLAVGSEGESSRALVEGCGWDYMEHPNSPLSFKFSALFAQAQQYKPDAVLLIGSDDLLSTNLLSFYQANYNAEAPYLMGLKDLYFYSVRTGKAIRHKGFIGTKAPFTIGCGRIYSRALLDTINWQPWNDQRIERGLDITTSRILEKMGLKERQVTMQEAGMAVDIKTDVGLTNMETFNFNCEAVNPTLLDFCFAEQLDKINSIFTK